MAKTETREPAVLDAADEVRQRRLAWAICLLLVFSVVLGALMAPVVHGALIQAGRRFAPLVDLRDMEFERVASRCVLACVALGLIPALWIGRVRGIQDIGLSTRRRWFRE